MLLLLLLLVLLLLMMMVLSSGCCGGRHRRVMCYGSSLLLRYAWVWRMVRVWRWLVWMRWHRGMMRRMVLLLCKLLLLLLVLLLLVLLLLMLVVLLLLLLSMGRLLCLPFAFLLRQLTVPLFALPGQLGIGRRFELEIRSRAGIVVSSIAASHKDSRLRTMAFGIVWFCLGTRTPVHVVHRGRWFRIRINVERLDVHRFVRMRRMMVTGRWWRWPMARMVMMRMMSGRWGTKTDATGGRMSMGTQGIHVARWFTAHRCQLVLNERIVWLRWPVR
uniref:Secreted peptide n=1 Tax=Anopheles braziliensis TaxID=58242 RepID=A0A2M3ZL18_9DIPT